ESVGETVAKSKNDRERSEQTRSAKIPAAASASAMRVAAIREAAARASKTAAPGGAYLLVVSANERGGRRFVRLAAPTVLGWFQRAWKNVEAGRDWSADLRGHVYGLDALFAAIEEEGLECPKTDAELVPLLERHIYFERDIEAEPH